MREIETYVMPVDGPTAYLEPLIPPGACVDWFHALVEFEPPRAVTEGQRLKAGLMFFAALAAVAEEMREWAWMTAEGWAEGWMP